MKENRSSITAEGIAIMRGIESLKPPGERICYDPYARQFANPPLWYLTKFLVDTGYTEMTGPGVGAFIVARERYIDDTLQSCIEEELEQLVILGAGFDSRAYRFEALKGRTNIFEVDHPATQQVKIEKLKKIFGELPGHVVYVPIDFTTETLGKRLYECGYDQRLKTLFIWQGVTPYLTPETVDSTLAFAANHSGQGSTIIFDYIYTWLLGAADQRGEIKRMRRSRRFTGEGLTFGIEEGTIEAFLQQRGFGQIKNVTAEDLKKAYFTGVNQKRKVAAGYAIVSARV